mmetsp:Transcript_5010/g.16427  ORF Transcript_5010/g.16427 Transcript_5010/m.16427 type:complete len:293 (+) Transcript_5010:10240-11118(+)
MPGFARNSARVICALIMMDCMKPPGMPRDSNTLPRSPTDVGAADGMRSGAGKMAPTSSSADCSGASRKTSTPLFRIARDTSPWRGSMAKNNRKFGCALTIRGSPPIKPHSLTSKKPSGSRRGFNRSRTVGEHRFAFSRSTHSPFITAFRRTPSTHSNLPASGEGPGAHAGCPRVSTRRFRSTEHVPSSISCMAFKTAHNAANVSPPDISTLVFVRVLYVSQALQAVLNALPPSVHVECKPQIDFSTINTSSSIAARSRLGSRCSNDPSSSLVSVAAVNAAWRSLFPDNVAKS